jgi:hypothetical protein
LSVWERIMLSVAAAIALLAIYVFLSIRRAYP